MQSGLRTLHIQWARTQVQNYLYYGTQQQFLLSSRVARVVVTLERIVNYSMWVNNNIARVLKQEIENIETEEVCGDGMPESIQTI